MGNSHYVRSYIKGVGALRSCLKYRLVLSFVACMVAAASALGQAESDKNVAGKDPTASPSAGDIHEPAETVEPRWRLRRNASEFGFEASYAPMQPVFFSGRKEYDTGGRKFAMTSFRYGKVLGTVKNVTYEYAVEVIPVAMAIKNEVRSGKASGTPTQRARTYAFGIQPLSFRFIFMPDRRLKPFVRVGAGFIFSAKPIPVPGSTTYNFIGDFGGGLMYHVTRKRTVNVGYRYFHISNMNIGDVNPGYNANVFYVGYSLFSK